jgi:uncharacterized membrane protein YeaQ/YmgE (transglycosylase-associated protein family)
MNILFWIVTGLIAGWAASVIMKTNSEQGMLSDILIGVVGAVVGGWLASLLGGADITGFNLYSLAVATFGAVVVIGLRKALFR